MNETLKLIESRRSIKGYTDKMPEKADVDLIVKAGLEAASGRNMQAAIIVAITDKEIRDKLSAANAAVCPYAISHWSVDSDDWNNRYHKGDTEEDWNATVNTIVNNVLSKVKEGDIILMHDIYESTYDATVILLQRLNEMGYNVVSVSELLGETQAGVIY